MDSVLCPKRRGASMPTKLEKHKENFLKRRSDIGANRRSAKQVLEFILEYRRILLDVRKGTVLAAQIDRETSDLMSAMDVNDPALLAIEKTIKRLAKGEGIEGLRLLDAKIKQDAEAFSERQRKIGLCPKVRLDGLTKRIERRLKQKKSLTCEMFIDELASSAPDKVVDEVDRNAKEVWLVEKEDPVTFGAIANRLSRAKRRLKI